MKIIITILLTTFCVSSLFASFKKVPHPLKIAACKIEQFPSSKYLLKEIEKEGPIRLDFKPLGKGPFSACWIGEARTILLNASNSWTLGEMISSILFEMHNAKRDKLFASLDSKAFDNLITKEEYVESIERFEFENSIMTKNIINEGIHKGFFPKDAFLPTYENFEEHYYWQLKLGHSALMARQYDDIRMEGESSVMQYYNNK